VKVFEKSIEKCALANVKKSFMNKVQEELC